MIEDKIFVISHHGCPPCETLIEVIKDKLPIYDLASSTDALKVAQKEKLMAIPTAFYQENGSLKKCDIKYSPEKIVLDCGKEHLEFER